MLQILIVRYTELYSNKFENLDKTETFPEKYTY